MDVDEILEKLERGEIKLYELDFILQGDVNKAAEIRRMYLERKLGIKLEHIGGKPIDLNLTFGRNIENAIGVAQIPIGIAGPIKIHGDYAKGEFFIPLATTEGALVASVNRGCSAITRSGGARAKVLKDGMARAPVFRVPNVDKAVELVSRVREHMDELRDIFKGVSKFLDLIDVQPRIVGRNVFLRFVARTGDAMGMNMVTIASEKAAEYIEKHLPRAKMVATSGNMCVDKKPNALNFILGRGKSVIAEAVIKREVVDKVLKTTPENVVEVVYRKIFVGSAQAASYGFNAHYANIIAAMFIACGQDAAQVVESSMGITTAEVTEEGDLYISVNLPSLEIGAVGGGMRLPTQQECLSILGLTDPNAPPRTRALKFAEIVASAVLAGELSLLGALAARHLGKAHEKLGRGRILKERKRFLHARRFVSEQQGPREDIRTR